MMESSRILKCMKEITETGKRGNYTPEEFKSAIDSIKLLIENKVKENEK